MSNSRMVDAVNRLVGNLLAGTGEVTLPGVGSLYVERHAARRAAKNSIVPPCRAVAYRSEERGVSLVDEIARAARVDADKSQEIYRTWLLRVSGENRLTIEGVGELRHKTFVLDAAFDAQLNPQGHKPVRLRRARRGFDFVLWLGVAAILFVAGFVGYWWQTEGRRSMEGVERVASVVAATDPTPGGLPADSVAAPAAPEVLANAAETNAAAQSAPADPGSASAASASVSVSAAATADGRDAASTGDDAVRAFASGRRYVVLGVFSSEDNVFRAVRQARATDPSLRPGVYRFGEKFLVSPFDAPDAESCTQFIRAHADNFPGMWTYAAR